MSFRVVRSAAWASVMSAATSGAMAQTPSFSLVGIAPGAPGTTASQVRGLSADGSVAAGNSLNGAAFAPGFTWTAAQGRYDFGLEPGVPSFTESLAISGDGATVVGRSFTSATGERAFRWRAGSGGGPGTFQTLDPLPGAARSWASGVSGDGSVIVGRAEGGPLPDMFGVAFRWTESGGTQALGFTRPGDVYSAATGVSRDGGTIVGFSRDGAGFADAFVWTEAGGFTILPQPPGTTARGAYAFATNVDGGIVVGVSGLAHLPVVWRNGQPFSLGTPDGWNGEPQSVSDDGSRIAGRMYSSTASTAAVWLSGGTAMPLADYLISCGVVIPAGWSLRDCFAVSGDGLTFAGTARPAAGPIQGFVATVPGAWTSAAVAVAMGVLGTGRRRRRGGGTGRSN